MNTETNFVKAYLRNENAHFSDPWLMSCIEWLKTENLGANYSLQELQTAVFEQWLFSDLRDIELASFPLGLANKRTYVLNGNYCAQIMQIIDISKPKFWQLQKIRNSNALTRDNKEDSEVAGTGKRMLQLTLSDGVQDVEAMEYRPIKCLNLNLSPGIKIRIIGPVTVRRGRIMLEEKNVKVLGGEIENLLVKNAAENVLARALNLTENPNPLKVEEKLLSTVQEENNQGYTSMVQIPQHPRAVPATVPPPVKSPVSIRKQPTFDLDDDLLSHELDRLLEAESEAKRGTEQSTRKMKSPDLFDDSTIEAAIDNLEFIANSRKVVTSNELFQEAATVVSSTKKPEGSKYKIINEVICLSDNDSPTKIDAPEIKTCKNVSPQSNFLNEEDLDFEDIDFNVALSSTQKPIVIESPKVSRPKTISIEKFLKLQHETIRAMFFIKGRFKEVVEKLSFADNNYRMTIKVEDDCNEVTVRLHSDIISEYAGYSPTEIISLKNDILQNDDDAKEKVMTALEKLRVNLLKIDNVMKIQVEKDKVPVILKII